MGQNNDTREHGDRQGQQGGQVHKSNPQDQQRQQQKGGMPGRKAGGGENADKDANKSSQYDHSGGNQHR